MQQHSQKSERSNKDYIIVIWEDGMPDAGTITNLMNFSTAIHNAITVMGVVVGGWWVIYRFGLKREKETALAIELTASSRPEGSHHLVFLDVAFTNKGSVVLTAKRWHNLAYKDAHEELKYSCSLLVRKVPAGLPLNKEVRWFTHDNPKSPLSTDIEVDLAKEYELEGDTDFWMEPGETYHLSTGLVLEKGSYLALVTFVSDRGLWDFWRRQFLLEVPVPVPNTASGTLAGVSVDGREVKELPRAA